jgi:hypothetical protein
MMRTISWIRSTLSLENPIPDFELAAPAATGFASNGALRPI